MLTSCVAVAFLVTLQTPRVSAPLEDLSRAMRWMWYQLDDSHLQPVRQAITHVHVLYGVPKRTGRPSLVGYLYHASDERVWMRSWVQLSDGDRLYPIRNAIAYHEHKEGVDGDRHEDGILLPHHLAVSNQPVQCLVTVLLDLAEKREMGTIAVSDLHGSAIFTPRVHEGETVACKGRMMISRRP